MNPTSFTASPDPGVQQLRQGLGCVLYALACIDGQLQSKEAERLSSLLHDDPDGPLVLQAFHIQYQYKVAVEDAYAYGLRRFAANRHAFTDDIKKFFVWVLEQMAAAHDGVSRKEHDLLKRFRRDINRL